MKKLGKVSAFLAAGALFAGIFTACDYTGDTTFEAAVAANAAPSNGGSGSGGNGTSTSYTYKWNFDTDISSSFSTVASGDFSGKLYLAADKTISQTSNSVGVDLTLYKCSDPTSSTAENVYNKADATTAIGSGTSIYSDYKAGLLNIGSVEPNGTKPIGIENIQGPFTITAYVGANSSSDKTDRYAHIMIGSEEVCAPNKAANKLSASCEKLTYSYTGTDKVNVYIGGSGLYVRVYNVTLTTTVKQNQYSSFLVTTNTDIANNVASLGLVGTSVASSKTDVATVKIESGKIAITSVAAGESTVTVTDSNSKTATIAVTVNGAGAVTTSVTKFARSAVTCAATTKASSSTATDGTATLTIDGLGGSLEYSTDNTTFYAANAITASIATFTENISGTTVTVGGLPKGKYYVRYAACDAYAASASTTVDIGDASVTVNTGSFDLLTSDLLGVGTTKGSIAANKTVTSGSLTLTASASATGVGTTTGDCGSYVYVAEKGTCIKKQALKLTGLAGGTLKIVAYMGSTSARNLEVTVGTTGATETLDMGTTSGVTKTYTKTLSGSDDVYIGASNEIYIQSITVTE